MLDGVVATLASGASKHSTAAALRSNIARESKRAEATSLRRSDLPTSQSADLALSRGNPSAAQLRAGALPPTSTTETTPPPSTLPHDHPVSLLSLLASSTKSSKRARGRIDLDAQQRQAATAMTRRA